MAFCTVNALLILAIFGLTTISAAAQEIDARSFTPITPDNIWEYEVTVLTGSPAVPRPYQLFIVRGDTMIDGEDYVIVQARYFNSSFEETFRRDCAFRFAETAPLGHEEIDLDTGEAYCDGFIPLPNMMRYSVELDTTIAIGDRRYDVDAVAYESESHSGTAGSGAGRRTSYAAGVGVYYQFELRSYHWAEQRSDEQWELNLTFARVNGVDYGRSSLPFVTSSKSRPGLREDVLLEDIYPNPFRNQISVRVTEPANIALFDMLGRRVALVEVSTGTSTISVSGLPSGVYLLRIYQRFGRSTSRQLAKLAD